MWISSNKLDVLFKEFFGDGLNAERFLNVQEFWIGLRILQQVKEPGLCCMAAFPFADDVRETAGRREPGFHADLTGFLDGGIFHFDIGKPPLFLGWRHKCDESGILFVPRLEVVSHEVADGGSGALQFVFPGQVNDQNVQFLIVGRGVGAKPFVTVDMVLEGILDILAVPGRRLGFVNVVQQVGSEVVESGLVEGLHERLANKGASLVTVHFASNR